MASATLTMTDNETTGEVSFEGALSEPVSPEALPTGAQIMFAYFSAHMPQLAEQAQEWFREGLVKNLAAMKEEIIHD
jgi:hypothetical protein